MSTLQVEGIRNAAASSDAITLAANGTCTAKVTNGLSNRNVIQNGEFLVAQRATSAAITGGGYHTVDRWHTVANSSMTYAVTMSQEDDGPPGFRKSLKLLTTTAKTPSGSENYILRTRLEEYDIYRFDYGRSGCKEATVSWWVKSNKTGTYSNQWYLKRNGSGDISMTTSYTINAANTWEKKTAVIPVYTTSFTHVTGTSCGLMMDWHLASGPDDILNAFSWTGQGSARAVNGQVNMLDTVNNYFQITGIQLEVGSTPTDFEHLRYGDELLRCQRYYNRVFDMNGQSGEKPISLAVYENGSNLTTIFNFPEMRAVPTLEITNGSNKFMIRRQDGSDSFDTMSMRYGTRSTAELTIGSNVSGNSGVVGMLRGADTDVYVAFSAEP